MTLDGALDCARYKLHIGLRHTKSPLPGSPFDLVVVPGPASAVTTMVPKGLPKRGYVGSKKDDGGFEMSLRSYDFMGNRCVEGGAKLKCMAVGTAGAVSADTVDNGNGTYTCSWHSEKAGKHKVQVLIGDEQVSCA